LSYYDGNHLSYLPHGVSAAVVSAGAEKFIRQFYSIKNIVARSFQTRLSFLGRLEFILFNICYGYAYQQWMAYNILKHPDNFRELLHAEFTPPLFIKISDELLAWIRKWRYSLSH
jgi:hypothetical protein